MSRPSTLPAALLALTLLFAQGCTKAPSPTELTALETARRDADQAEKQVRSLEGELKQLQSELERERQTLQENRDDLHALQGSAK